MSVHREMTLDEYLESKLREERDKLAAHVERLQQELRRCLPLLHCHFPTTDKDAAYKDAVACLKDNPETSLARLKAQWQAEILWEFTHGSKIMPAKLYLEMSDRAKKLRRQAEGDTDEH